MKTFTKRLLAPALLCALSTLPGISSAGNIDSFFDIWYEISPASSSQIPQVTARLHDGSLVPLTHKGSVKFSNGDKSFTVRMTLEQELDQKSLIEITARCDAERCVINDVQTKAPTHRGHVTVLK